VWSLWLSSAVIGYAMIVWSIFGGGASIATKAWQGREQAEGNGGRLAVGGAVMLAGGLFMLAFFTVHFGMFHFVHSVFLNAFFPVEPGLAKSFPGPGLYWEVFQRYWWFLPAAAIAERAAFKLPFDSPAEPPDTSVKAEDVARRLGKPKKGIHRHDGALQECGAPAPVDLLLRRGAFRAVRQLPRLCRRVCGVFLPLAAG
jgi:hypothetical protein